MSLYADPARRAAIHALLDATWPGLSARVRLAASLGWDWHAVSTPFARFVGDEAVGHVGLIDVPVVIDGEELVFAGLHAVCVRPEHRGRGLARALLAEALAAADERGATAVLYTDKPGVYTPHGFRVVPQHFAIVDRPAWRGGRLVPLAHTRPDDVARVAAAVAGRAPLSRVFASRDPGWLFGIDECLASGGFSRLYDAPELGAVVAFETRGDEVLLLDVVAAELPPLDAVLAALPGDGPVTLCFSPDRFDASPRWVEGAWDGDRLLVRGPLAVEARRFMAPPLMHH